MSPMSRLAAFAAVLTVLFAGGALLGSLTEPEASGDEAEPSHAPAAGRPAAHGDAAGGHADAAPAGADAGADVHGLAVADAGLRVEVVEPELPRGERATVAFRVVDEEGEPVRDYDVTHERRMHLILVRRDLTGFQHLHPELRPDGTWEAQATLRRAGSYRLFADFAHAGEAITLASDLRVDGPADLRPLPEPAPRATSDGGYEVALAAADAHAGREASLRFTITRDGRRVRTEPYLGAGGHLVALREGDLAFLHVHPTEEGDAVGFAATFPTEGRYRLFLQFKHAGRVQTVAFTQEVGR